MSVSNSTFRDMVVRPLVEISASTEPFTKSEPKDKVSKTESKVDSKTTVSTSTLESAKKYSYLTFTTDANGVAKLGSGEWKDKVDFKKVADSFASKVAGSLGTQLEKAEATDVVELTGAVNALTQKVDKQITENTTLFQRFLAVFKFGILGGLRDQKAQLAVVSTAVKARTDAIGGAEKANAAVKELEAKEKADKEKADVVAKNEQNKKSLQSLREEKAKLDNKKVVVNGKTLTRKEIKAERKKLDEQIKTLVKAIKTYEKANNKDAYKAFNKAEFKAKKSELKSLQGKVERREAKLEEDLKEKKEKRLKKEIEGFQARIESLDEAIEKYIGKHPKSKHAKR